jgi:hypothetical protein
MIDSSAFAKMMPGLDFVNSLMRGAGQAVPAMGSWIAPTLDPQEIDKRIGELKTVHFWLEQNARMVGATIQALEVQRMTLGTLQTMNLPLAELRQAMMLPEAGAASPAPTAASTASADPSPPSPVDPMQWWTALTQQFGAIAAKAVQDGQALAAAAAPKVAPARAAAVRKSTGRARTRKP